MKRVGLVTCYVNNYGACLQAYALQNTMKDMGYECEIVQYSPQMEAIALNQVNLKNPDTPMVRVLRTIRHPMKLYYRKKDARNARQRTAKFEAFKKTFLTFGAEKYPTTQHLYDAPPPYDAFVCGSDQIWNPVIHHNRNVLPYFLDFAPSGTPRIAYAPSIGVSEIPECCQKQMGELISKMDAVSVREIDGVRLVKELAQRECREVLDPTLLFNAERWSRITSPVAGVEKPYILCYLFGEQQHTYDFVRYTKEKTGYEVVSLPFSYQDIYSSGRKIYDAGPQEFLWLIQNAALVITDSFHATAFSINFNRPFYSLLRNETGEANNMNSRIYSILEKTGLQNRLLSRDAAYPKEIDFSIDYQSVNRALDECRKKDKAFLQDALECKR